MNEIIVIDNQTIQNKIYTIRDMQVIIDRDLAELYGVETKRINEAVKNNQDKFQSDFFFELSNDEFTILKPNNYRTNLNLMKSSIKYLMP